MAWRLTLHARHPLRKLKHSIAVALAALRLGQALRDCGLPFDAELTVGGGLLHDIRHASEHNHAIQGAALMRRLGWPDVAFVVGCHTVLPPEVLRMIGIFHGDYGFKTPEGQGPPPEKRLLLSLAAISVYLADKYCMGDVPVTIAERFSNIRHCCKRRSKIQDGMEQRQRVAVAVESWIGGLTGGEPLSIVKRPSAHPYEEHLRVMHLRLLDKAAEVTGETPDWARL